MTATPIINEGFAAEIVTFPRNDPAELGAFLDLVAGCEFVCADEDSGYDYSVQIDPRELHVQVEFPVNTRLQDADYLIGDLFMTGSMAEEIRSHEEGVNESIDERFRKIVERFGEEQAARKKITDLGSPLVSLSQLEDKRELDPDQLDDLRMASSSRTKAMLERHGDSAYRFL